MNPAVFGQAPRKAAVPDEAPMRVKFHHGLGDVLMFRNVLEAVGRPVEIFLNPALGQGAVFAGHATVKVVAEPPDPLAFKDVRFAMERSRPCRSGVPTKARICLEHEFGIIRPDLQIRPLPLDNLEDIETPAIAATRRFLEGIGPYVACHFQGTWSPDAQNPDPLFARKTVESIIALGFRVVLINYDYAFHNPRNRDLDFVDGDRVRSTYRNLPLAFESLWHLIKNSTLFIGVDSGPLHTAACLGRSSVYLRKETDFMTDFYDCGLDTIVAVDANSQPQVPSSLLERLLEGRRDLPPGPPRMAKTGREQAEFFHSLYSRYREEVIETGLLHDAKRLGNRGQVFRTDAEMLYCLIRLWKPDAVVDFCTGSGDALSYMLLALARNDEGVCLSADRQDRAEVLLWLKRANLPTDRLLLFDEQDIRPLLETLKNCLRNKERVFWLLDTDHEYEMGQWQLENIIKPYACKSIFAKDDIVAVDDRLESDMGALYAVREHISASMEVYSTNAAFGSTAGAPCSQQPYKGAQGRVTPGSIPFKGCRRNEEVQSRIFHAYPRWDPTACKMIYFFNKGRIPA